MQRVMIVLFVFGCFLEVAGFAVSQVENMPLVLNLICPEYYRGMDAIERLEADDPLEPGETGFSDLGDIIMGWLKKENPPEKVDSIFIHRFEAARGMEIKYGSTSLFKIKKVRFFLSNDQVFSIDADRLKNELEELRTSCLFRWALRLLIFGIFFVQIPMFVVQLWQPQKKET